MENASGASWAVSLTLPYEQRCYEKCMHFSSIICCCGVEGDCVVEFKGEEGQMTTKGEGIDMAEGEVPEVL